MISIWREKWCCINVHKKENVRKIPEAAGMLTRRHVWSSPVWPVGSFAMPSPFEKSFRTRAKRELVNKTVYGRRQDWGQVEKVSPYPSQGDLTWKNTNMRHSTYCGMPLQNIWSRCHHHPSTLVVSDLEGTRAMTRAIDGSIYTQRHSTEQILRSAKTFFFYERPCHYLTDAIGRNPQERSNYMS